MCRWVGGGGGSGNITNTPVLWRRASTSAGMTPCVPYMLACAVHVRSCSCYARCAAQEVNRVSEVVTSLADPSANVIFGAVIDDQYEGGLSKSGGQWCKVTVHPGLFVGCKHVLRGVQTDPGRILCAACLHTRTPPPQPPRRDPRDHHRHRLQPVLRGQPLEWQSGGGERAAPRCAALMCRVHTVHAARATTHGNTAAAQKCQLAGCACGSAQQLSFCVLCHTSALPE